MGNRVTRRLGEDRRALNELAAKVRAPRANEKNVYQSVRDTFAIGSVDYAKNSGTARSFYARPQDRFLHAVTAASEIKLDRADHRKPAMGLTCMKRDLPGRADADVGKSHLDAQEVRDLHVMCELFLTLSSRRRSTARLSRWPKWPASSKRCYASRGARTFLDTAISWRAEPVSTPGASSTSGARVRSLPRDERHVA